MSAPETPPPSSPTPSDGAGGPPSGDATADEALLGSRAFAALDLEIAALELRSRRWTRARLVSFLVLAAVLIAGADWWWLPLVAAPMALVVFLVAIFRHGAVLDRKRLAENRRLLLAEAHDRRAGSHRFRDAPTLAADPTPLEEGRRVFRPEASAFPIDEAILDDLQVLGGRRSLFGLLDVSSTVFGALRLHHLLTHPCRSSEEIRRRQEAVAELGAPDGLRAEVLEALVGMRGERLEELPRSLYAPTALARRRGLAVTAHVLGTLAPLVLAAGVLHGAFLGIAFALVLVNITVIGAHSRRSSPARDRLLRFGPLLRGLERLRAALAARPPRSAALAEASEQLERLAPAARKLSRTIALLELHDYGIAFEIWNALVLWELRLLPGAEALFERHRDELERAVGALGEIEALSSLAGPLEEQAGFVLPTLVEDGSPLFDARAMGHPLLDLSTAVRNDLSLGRREADAPRIVILTGSNMSGKSTYLKAAGTNLLLAQAGGPVCAASLSWTPLCLFTDINVRDSLDDGKSYFQVEVERVLRTIHAAEAGEPVFAIFDELFRGTNAEERIALARAILRHLRRTPALMVVATHDAALTRLVTEERTEGVANFHLREEVLGGEMRFDYTVRPGPAVSRNATRVLEVSGYPRDITEAARAELGESEESPAEAD